jgi:hypothetical protein
MKSSAAARKEAPMKTTPVKLNDFEILENEVVHKPRGLDSEARPEWPKRAGR